LHALVDQLIGQAVESDMAREFHVTQMIFELNARNVKSARKREINRRT
jgi:hypothetical protein